MIYDDNMRKALKGILFRFLIAWDDFVKSGRGKEMSIREFIDEWVEKYMGGT